MKKKNIIWILPLTISICLLFLTSCEKEPEKGTVTDNGGYVYQTVKIGSQWWMAENLRTTKYSDGTAIPNIIDNTGWNSLTSGAYCWYNNDKNAYTDYGALYNWYAVSTGKLCPTGWHVPSIAEWTTLFESLGGTAIAGEKMKETGTDHWPSPNSATNESGFTALPGGYRNYNGDFLGNGGEGEWFTSQEKDDRDAYEYYIYPNNTISQAYYWKKSGQSIRCVKD